MRDLQDFEMSLVSGAGHSPFPPSKKAKKGNNGYGNGGNDGSPNGKQDKTR